MRKLGLSFLSAVLLGAFHTASAQEAVTVSFGNFSSDGPTQTSLLLRDEAGIALSQGMANVNTDGALIQLGYYSMATAGNNFLGDWIPITGFNSTLGTRTSIGDSADLAGSGNGRISFGATFSSGTNQVRVYTFDPDGFNSDPGTYETQSQVTIMAPQPGPPAVAAVPPSGQIMSIRFYNNSAGNALYNAASSNSWTWIPPSLNPTTNTFDFAAAQAAGSLVFENFDNPFRTVILVPEPSTYALLGVGALLLARARFRKRAKV